MRKVDGFKDKVYLHDSVDVRVVHKESGSECDPRMLMLREFKNVAEIVDFVDNYPRAYS